MRMRGVTAANFWLHLFTFPKRKTCCCVPLAIADTGIALRVRHSYHLVGHKQLLRCRTVRMFCGQNLWNSRYPSLEGVLSFRSGTVPMLDQFYYNAFVRVFTAPS
eukprot:scpid95432/ scgid30490/ 